MADLKVSQRAAFVAGLFLLLSIAFMSVGSAQTAYKYRGDDGEWIFSDRPPPDGSIVEVRELERTKTDTNLRVSYNVVDRRVQLVASNRFYIPVELELELEIESIRGLEHPDPGNETHWVVPARSDLMLVDLAFLDGDVTPFLDYRIRFHPGDPGAEHRPAVPYRVPLAVATNYRVSQAFPDIVTHTAPDSYYAVDIAMPIGTDIFAARDGIVFDVASGYFEAGLDPQLDGPKANVVQILHDDGTFSVYAHLNTNTVRVRPGDHVRRGQYIADSGNTGYSNGPHLHFAVMRNVGMRAESVPVSFEGASNERVTPATGMNLTAY